MVRYGVVRYGTVYCDMVWYGLVWYGLVWYGTVWYGLDGSGRDGWDGIGSDSEASVKSSHAGVRGPAGPDSRSTLDSGWRLAALGRGWANGARGNRHAEWLELATGQRRPRHSDAQLLGADIFRAEVLVSRVSPYLQ